VVAEDAKKGIHYRYTFSMWRAMPTVVPHSRTSPDAGSAVAHHAYTRLRHLVVRGSLAPASRVAEGDLASRLGISRTPAREAMRRLLAEGLLVRDGGGERPRLAVAPVGSADVVELYDAAAALEGIASRAAAQLDPAVRRALVATLRSCEAAFRRASAKRPLDYDELFERHNAFHEALMAACAGPATRALLDALRPRLDRYEWLYAPVIGPDFSDTFAEHGAIIAAVKAGDAAACERAVRRNWMRGGRRLAKALAARAVGDAR
jgi:DNA-binding GntR family transcriptional regulator